MNLLSAIYSMMLVIAALNVKAQNSGSDERYRPKIHFSPEKHWVNDPNGMVFYKGVYHLFFQHHPYSSVWGPMHWGHATSTDLVHWKHEPIALYPDSLGAIFSGSAVIDEKNTSGFGKPGKPAMVAIFTHHNAEQEKLGRNDFQNQSLAYSTDNGKSWTKYSGNPVLKNPGIRDFRDPKVFWYEPQQKWIMTLATLDDISFYSSPDLKSWMKESEFGKTAGAHGGVWECPDLFSLDDHGKKVWVLIVNINPGGPNRGSATQYFLGDFNGKVFTPYDTKTKWLDYGPDEYAGITWANTGERKIFLGWMSNWLYANLVPTETWRNAMTIPRELKLVHSGNEIYVSSMPVKELKSIESTPIVLENIAVENKLYLDKKIKKVSIPSMLSLRLNNEKDFSVVLSNKSGEELKIGYDKNANEFYIDRTKSGQTGFEKDFALRHTAPRFIEKKELKLNLIFDMSSVELFADDGLTVMTEIFFPTKPYDQIRLESTGKLMVDKLSFAILKN